jgi:ABC-type sugar transport system substrate-binding protein
MNGHIGYQLPGGAGRLRVATIVAATVLAGVFAQQAIAEEVIASATFDVTSPEYLKWSKETCQFEPAEGKGPYVAEVRKSDTPIRIVFTPEEQTNPVFVAQAKKLVELGKQANVEVTVLDNAFPDTMRPVQNADQAVQMKVDLVLSELIMPDLNPAVQQKYKDACIPMVNIFGMPKYPYPAPTIQAIHRENGVTMAKAAIDIIKAKGWSADQIWIVSCGDPVTATGPGTAEDLMLGFADTVKAAFGIPDDHISPVLVCSQANGPLGSKEAVTDWLTAHPNAKYVVASAWNDVKAFGMAQALEAAGYTSENALTAGRDANTEQLAAMKAGSILQVNLDLKLIDGWPVAMIGVAQDILAGKPVPAKNVPAAKPLTANDL